MIKSDGHLSPPDGISGNIPAIKRIRDECKNIEQFGDFTQTSPNEIGGGNFQRISVGILFQQFK